MFSSSEPKQNFNRPSRSAVRSRDDARDSVGSCCHDGPAHMIYVKILDMSEHDQPLGFLMYQLMAALRPHVNAELRPLGIGLAEFVCMRNISMWPDQSNAELARRANVTPQAMSLVLRALEDRALIARPEAVPSGRSLPARLTRKGAALLKRAEKSVQVADARLLDALTPAERNELKRLLYVSSSRYLNETSSA
jgi:DNA-binding MarR family transcriptional regulator